jgi:purine-nucleoside/S-methyl-5'-thioadenosine phosphorylase / adenosine deaminase
MVLNPDIFAAHSEIIAAMSTRKGGSSLDPFGMNLSYRVGDDPDRVRRNREQFFGSNNIPLAALAIPGQIHGNNIQVVDAPGEYPDRDALITASREVYLCVTVADCVPILLYEPVARVIGAVHAGWRGTARNILASTIARMESEFGAHGRDLLAYCGPAAGVCCYVVGEEVAARFDRQFVSRNGDGTVVDLKSANRHQLLEAGVRQENIEISSACTITDSANFHSHRRDRERSGRMMAVIGLRKVDSLR